MRDLIKIAWRNLWRNKRRTLITAASIFFAIFFAATMRSFQLGTYDHMIKQAIEAYSGYIQVQNADYFDDPGIDNVFEPTPALMAKILADPNVKVAVPRVESFALASTGNLSKGVLITGISTEKERMMSNPEQKLVRYRITDEAIRQLEKKVSLAVLENLKQNRSASFTSEPDMLLELELNKESKSMVKAILQASKMESHYLTEKDEGVLISDRLSKYLKVGIGDSVILMGQGYQGVSAADLFPVRGIVKLPAPDLDNKVLFMSIEKASEFLSLSGQITSIAINLNETDEMKETQAGLIERINDDRISVKNWEQLNPTLKQQIESDSQSGQLFLAVLYIIIFFGIFGTVQMMISERTREFGVMVAIGMKRGKLAMIVVLEMLFIGLMGTIAGLGLSVPLILYGYYYPFKITGDMAQMYIDYGFDPVMPMAWFNSYFFWQAAIVFVMVLVAIYQPVRNILKLNVIKSIHG
ncbi:MAG: FtsX-like permease family protein [Bacteroidales bacterium]|nr:FtsX-like permease family protein [Bacteroidales bacterium]